MAVPSLQLLTSKKIRVNLIPPPFLSQTTSNPSANPALSSLRKYVLIYAASHPSYHTHSGPNPSQLSPGLLQHFLTSLPVFTFAAYGHFSTQQLLLLNLKSYHLTSDNFLPSPNKIKVSVCDPWGFYLAPCTALRLHRLCLLTCLLCSNMSGTLPSQGFCTCLFSFWNTLPQDTQSIPSPLRNFIQISIFLMRQFLITAYVITITFSTWPTPFLHSISP